MLFLHNKDQQ